MIEQPNSQALPGPEENPFRNQHIKSFVKRRGHISKAQERALEQGMPKWGIAYQPQTIHFDSVWNRDNAPTWLEIGFGMGETTAPLLPDIHM